MKFFEKTPLAPPDPLLGVNVAFKQDSRPGKVNLSIGTYKTAESASVLLRSVQQAEDRLVQRGVAKEYLPIDGDDEFLQCAKNLVFSKRQCASYDDKILCVQALGGTGALRIGGDFFSKYAVKKIYIPDLTWVNHQPVFTAAGLQVEQYPYFDVQHLAFDFPRLCSFIQGMDRGSIMLLQASCNNPSATDPSKEQWKELASLIHQQEILPFFDIAYQGFGTGVEEDVFSVRLFADLFDEMCAAYSFSKNFGLYGERAGAFFVKAKSADTLEKILSQLKILIRRNYSSPPRHGAGIIKTVCSSPDLRFLWEAELKHMRERVIAMRQAFVSGMMAKQCPWDVSQVAHQTGLFAFLGLGKEHATALNKEYGIFIPNNGRINLAGLNSNNMEYVIDAIIAVLS